MTQKEMIAEMLNKVNSIDKRLDGIEKNQKSLEKRVEKLEHPTTPTVTTKKKSNPTATAKEKDNRTWTEKKAEYASQFTEEERKAYGEQKRAEREAKKAEREKQKKAYEAATAYCNEKGTKDYKTWRTKYEEVLKTL